MNHKTNFRPCDKVSKVNVLGIGVAITSILHATNTVLSWIEDNRKEYVTVTGAHGMIESQANTALKNIHNRAGLVVPDGMPLVWLSKWARHAEAERVYGPDLMRSICRQSANKSIRHFLYGASDQVLRQLESSLKTEYPGITIAGSYAPPIKPAGAIEDGNILKQINDSQCHIVWVGLSTPKQELWMSNHRDKLNANILLGVGAAFDFLSGVKEQAPTWIQNAGLEWAYRLMQEPRRLGRRYGKIVPNFIYLSLLQKLKLREFPLE